MADKFYSLNRGQPNNPDNVTVGDATSAGSDIELRIELGAGTTGWTTLEITAALDALKRRIIDGRDSVIGQV